MLEELKAACTSAKTITVVDNRELGAALRERRKAAGIGLNEMAGRLGISSAFLSDCERGNRNLSEEYQLAYVREIAKNVPKLRKSMRIVFKKQKL